MLYAIKIKLEKALAIVTSVMLVILVALAVWQVVSRYILQTPALFTEELLRFSMIWMALLGSAYAFSLKEHLALLFFVDRLQGTKKKLVMLWNDMVVFFFTVFILFMGGLKAVDSTLTQFSPIMRIAMGHVYLILPITAVLIFVLQAINTYLMLTDQVDHDSSTTTNSSTV